MGMITRNALIFALILPIAACKDRDAITGYDSLIQHVSKSRVGSSPDQWIEMKGLSGEWEKTGLIFEYEDDLEVCNTVIEAMKKAYPLREYRCTIAN